MRVAAFWRELASSIGDAVRRDRALAKAVAAVTFAGLISIAFASMDHAASPSRTSPPTLVKGEAFAAVKQDQLVELNDEALPGEPARPADLSEDPGADEVWPPRESFAEAETRPSVYDAVQRPDRRANTGVARGAEPEARSTEAAADGSDEADELPNNARAPTDCLPDPLKAVLRDLTAEFPDATVVSTTHLHTDNHSRGSARARMHGACRAVDIKTSNPREVIAFLKGRSEVGGINTYRNKVVHFDLAAGYARKRLASRRTRR